ncbi:MAG: MmgE/PrpD family protein [Candidatus Bathyarchaeia archaeon]
MAIETISWKLSEFAYNLKLKNVPERVVSKAKLHVLDTAGIMMAACNLEIVKKVVKVCKLLCGPPESTVIGHGLKLGACNAALANATMAHSTDYDDTHLGSVHQSCMAVPTAFAVAESVNASGREALEALIVAYEVCARLGLVAPKAYHAHCWHPTPVIGVFGSALTAGKLMGLTVEQLAWALGIAGSLASGIGQTVVEGVPVKPMHPGFAAHAGIMSSLLAKEGLKGPYQIFEGRNGFFNAYLRGEKLDIEQAVSGLGERWETLNMSLKPYPSCHATHSAIDAAIILKKKYDLRLEDIEECTYYLPKSWVSIGERWKVDTAYGAKFSLPYCVIVALKKGRVSLEDFADDAIRDVEVTKHLTKVKAVPNESYDSEEYRGKLVIPAKAKIRTKDGKLYEEEVVDHKGTPCNPMTEDEVIAKFMCNIESSKFKGLTDEVINRILNLENHSVEEVMHYLR